MSETMVSIDCTECKYTGWFDAVPINKKVKRVIICPKCNTKFWFKHKPYKGITTKRIPSLISKFFYQEV